MTSRLCALVLDAVDPARVADFWAGLLDRETVVDDDWITVLAADDSQVPIDVAPGAGIRWGPNQMHFDLTSSSLEDQQATVDRVLSLGGRHLDIGQGPDVTHVVMADPEGNELCVIAPGNTFLAGTARIGALSSDGTQACGYFWSAALGWPLVWDVDEETTIQSPRGGSKISWGGPPVNPKRGKNRWHLDIAPPPGESQEAEVTRLLGLGATRIDIGQGEADWVVMADPDGNEFCVLSPR